ncbi:peptide deformylase [Rhodobacteraceae bacterium 2376]|uniref:Peptide deformylase n=1 Tax=Rhabdonatronobacter sediminivivens TaxID=2743469 RepID=A0A7Z0HYG8_9RHOB|nr:peptide deformylase [Rhabdonatronobacter sediminivivens]NYS24624.1 peptide deformylase [Rhabdonatronobacter sediminivivens]
MARLPILRHPNPVLRRVALPVEDVATIRALAADMLDTMYAAPGRGLAGPQVGVLRRIFVMDPGWKEGARDPFVCINPEILGASGRTEAGVEGCLSIPGLPLEVERPAEITLRWTDAEGTEHTRNLDGAAARCAQHELDHLNGRLILDLLDEPARQAAAQRLIAMGCG